VIEAEDRFVASHLPRDGLLVDLRHRGGLLIREGLSHHEAIVLADNKLVNAVLSKSGRFKYLILKGSTKAANRVLKVVNQTGLSLRAEDNYTVRSILCYLPNGRRGMHYEPNFRRCNAYKRKGFPTKGKESN